VMRFKKSRDADGELECVVVAAVAAELLYPFVVHAIALV